MNFFSGRKARKQLEGIRSAVSGRDRSGGEAGPGRSSIAGMFRAVRSFLLRPGQGRVVLVTFLVCFGLGLGLVIWRAKGRQNAARERARTEVLARAQALQMQFAHAVTAAEVLGALARQNGGNIPNFQQVATELLSGHPGLASLEIQPGGVVADIAPRAGQEERIGFNVFTDPAHQPWASAAMQARTLMVTGPLRLPNGEPGLVIRVPVSQRERDGREAFRAFAAVSVGIGEAFRRARVDELFARGYAYLFYAPPTAQQPGMSIAGRGGWAPDRAAVEQSVRVRNAEFRLAVQPRGGWIQWWPILLEMVAVLALAGLASGLMMSPRTRLEQSGTRAVADAESRLKREVAQRERLERELHEARQQSAAVRSKLDVVEHNSLELKQRLDAAAQAIHEVAQSNQENIQQTEITIADLQTRLEAATAETKVVSESADARLQEAHQTIQHLETKLQQAASAESRVAELTALLEAIQQASETEQAPSPSPPTEPDPPIDPTARPPMDQLHDQDASSPASADPMVDLPAAPASEPGPEDEGAGQERAEQDVSPIAPDPGMEPEVPPEPPLPPEPPPEPIAPPAPKRKRPKTGRSAKRKKALDDSQMKLFASEPVPAEPESSQEPTSEPSPEPLPQENIAFPPEPESQPPPTSYVTVLPEPTAEPPSSPAPPELTESNPLLEVVPSPDATVDQPDSASPPSPKPKKSRASTSRSAAAKPVDPEILRTAIRQILPLLIDQDPGAKDCLKDNRAAFRGAFTAEAYDEFERCVKSRDYNGAVEQLKKAAKKHGINVPK